jgi:flagellar motor protein MotB
MSSKLFAIGLVLAAVASTGCQGKWVAYDQYSRDTAQLREYNDALERDNAQLRAIKEAFDRLQLENAAAGRGYEDLAETLKKAIAGLDVATGDVYVGDKGQLVFADDLLFNRGSWDISAKGKELLKRFAQSHHGSQVKIIGYTDKTRVVSVALKGKLFTDTNMELSALRGVAVGAELIRNGIAERNIWIEGRGATELKATDAASRRVEIFVIGDSVKTSKK